MSIHAFPSIPDSVTRAVLLAEAKAQAMGLAEETLMRVGLAVSEAVANAVEHGNNGDAAREIHLDIAPEAHELCVRVRDEGHGFPTTRLVSAALPSDPLQTDGRGLFLIRELTDRVEMKGSTISLWFSDRS